MRTRIHSDIYIHLIFGLSETENPDVINADRHATQYARSWASMPEVAFVAASDVNAASRRPQFEGHHSWARKVGFDQGFYT